MKRRKQQKRDSKQPKQINNKNLEESKETQIKNNRP